MRLNVKNNSYYAWLDLLVANQSNLAPVKPVPPFWRDYEKDLSLRFACLDPRTSGRQRDHSCLLTIAIERQRAGIKLTNVYELKTSKKLYIIPCDFCILCVVSMLYRVHRIFIFLAICILF